MREERKNNPAGDAPLPELYKKITPPWEAKAPPAPQPEEAPAAPIPARAPEEPVPEGEGAAVSPEEALPPDAPEQAPAPPAEAAPAAGNPGEGAAPQPVPPVGEPVPPPAGPGWGPPPQWQPPQAYGQPLYPGYPAGGWGPPSPRRKMSRSLKVFLWIVSVLAAGALVGFAAFAVYAGVTGGGPALPTEGEPPFVESQPEAPESSSQEEPALELPDVDVTPNEEGIVIHEKPEGDSLDAQQVYDRVVRSTVAVTVSRTGEETDGSGTGIIATGDGYIITNAHVVLNTKNVLVTVTTFDGQQYDAVVVGMDRTTDLAVLKTDDHGFTPAEFGDAGELSIGEWVMAIGNPGGERFSSSLTRGIVSGLDRAVERYSEEGMTYIQTDAAINPGNSGGPLVNMYGQVVGINSSKIITEGYEGMGFAIPVSKAKDILDQLLSGGYVEGRVRLGITGYDLGAEEAAFYGVPQGFLIASIDEDSSFAGTQAQVHDIITAIDGEPVEELQDISNLLLRYSPGDQVTVTLYRMNENNLRQGEEIDVTITLLEDRGETQQ